MNHQQVLDYLPHKPPFLFVDTVDRVEVPDEIKDKKDISPRDLVGTKAVANFLVKDDLEIIKGHFPGNPILPGVIQIEMMAQTSAFNSLALNDLNPLDVNVDTILMSVESSKFRKLVTPGMLLEIHAEMEKCRGNIASYKCEIFHEGERVSEARFLARLILQKDK